jgi:hypothetical protein
MFPFCCLWDREVVPMWRSFMCRYKRTVWNSVRIDKSLTVPIFGAQSSPSCEWGTVTALQSSLFCINMMNALAFDLEYKLRKWTVVFMVHTLFTDVYQLQSIFSVKWQIRIIIRSESLWWYINTSIMFLDIIHHCAFIQTQRFGGWILSPPSRGTYSVGPSR